MSIFRVYVCRIEVFVSDENFYEEEELIGEPLVVIEDLAKSEAEAENIPAWVIDNVPAGLVWTANPQWGNITAPLPTTGHSCHIDVSIGTHDVMTTNPKDISEQQDAVRLVFNALRGPESVG